MTSLALTELGTGAEKLVFLHGFTQTGRTWVPIVERLAEVLPHARSVLVDLPGHGNSAEVHADLRGTAELIATQCGFASYVGYSLGARVAMQLLIDHPAQVRRALLISGTAGIEDEGDRLARTKSDAALANRLMSIGVEAFLKEWLAQPLFSDLTAEMAMIDDRRRNTARGLAESLQLCGQGNQEPLWRRLATSTVPILAVAGARDVKYVALARRIAATAPHGRLCVIPDAGHSAALERPDIVSEVIYDWMTNPSAYSTPTTS